MKRGGFLQRKTFLKAKSDSPSAVAKENIQALLRAIVIKRDGGCIFRNIEDYDGIPACNGYTKAGELVLQADHLITRANSATYADSRLVVCVCKGHHLWKKYHEQQYNALVQTVLSSGRVLLWDMCEKMRWKPTRKYASDWLKEEAALKQELRALQ